MRGCQCAKSLWLHKYQKEARDATPEATQAVLGQGINLGVLARQLYPNGVDLSFRNYYEYQNAVQNTYSYMAMGYNVLYEAAFEYNNILIFIDIMLRYQNRWYIYEVKSSTKVKQEHKEDAALQYYVLSHLGVDVADFCITHINANYRRIGNLDIRQLFTSRSVLSDIVALQPYTSLKIAECFETLHLPSAPDVAIDTHCFMPYTCDYLSHCHKVHQSQALFELTGDDGLLLACQFYKNNIYSFDEMPEEIALSPQQYRQLLAHKSKELWVDKEGLQAFCKMVAANPVYVYVHTTMNAVPEFDHERPYELCLVAYSLQNSDDSEPIYKGRAQSESPKHILLPELVDALAPYPAIVVYDNRLLKVLQNYYPYATPATQQKIDHIKAAVVEIGIIFSTLLVYHSTWGSRHDLDTVYNHLITPIPTPEPDADVLRGQCVNNVKKVVAVWQQVEKMCL